MLLSHLTYKVLLHITADTDGFITNVQSHFTYKALPQFIVWNKQWIGFCLLHFSFALKRKPSACFLRRMRRFRLLPIPENSHQQIQRGYKIILLNPGMEKKSAERAN